MDSQPLWIETGARLRAARGRRSQRELAAALHISPSLLCRLEKGERRLTVSVARSLDDYLGTDPAFTDQALGRRDRRSV
jgi:transcriptional regulator with XRE-family HTH domain